MYQIAIHDPLSSTLYWPQKMVEQTAGAEPPRLLLVGTGDPENVKKLTPETPLQAVIVAINGTQENKSPASTFDFKLTQEQIVELVKVLPETPQGEPENEMASLRGQLQESMNNMIAHGANFELLLRDLDRAYSKVREDIGEVRTKLGSQSDRMTNLEEQSRHLNDSLAGVVKKIEETNNALKQGAVGLSKQDVEEIVRNHYEVGAQRISVAFSDKFNELQRELEKRLDVLKALETRLQERGNSDAAGEKRLVEIDKRLAELSDQLTKLSARSESHENVITEHQKTLRSIAEHQIDFGKKYIEEMQALGLKLAEMSGEIRAANDKLDKPNDDKKGGEGDEKPSAPKGSPFNKALGAAVLVLLLALLFVGARGLWKTDVKSASAGKTDPISGKALPDDAKKPSETPPAETKRADALIPTPPASGDKPAATTTSEIDRRAIMASMDEAKHLLEENAELKKVNTAVSLENAKLRSVPALAIHGNVSGNHNLFTPSAVNLSNCYNTTIERTIPQSESRQTVHVAMAAPSRTPWFQESYPPNYNGW